jgi:hypothetical protein
VSSLEETPYEGNANTFSGISHLPLQTTPLNHQLAFSQQKIKKSDFFPKIGELDPSFGKFGTQTREFRG